MDHYERESVLLKECSGNTLLMTKVNRGCVCTKCEDSLFVVCDKDELIEYLGEKYFLDNITAREMIVIYRHWKLYGEIPCKVCVK